VGGFVASRGSGTNNIERKSPIFTGKDIVDVTLNPQSLAKKTKSANLAENQGETFCREGEQLGIPVKA